MRLFLAIDLPEKIKEELDAQIHDLRKQYPDFNWVSKKNFHITVHYFGETNNLEKIKEKIKDLLFASIGFYLYSTAVDVFANHKLVIHLEFKREKKLEDVAEMIKNNFDGNEYNEKKFIPHLTLARGRRSSKQQYFALKKKMQKVNIDISFKTRKLVLFESILEGGKPIYKKLASLKLLDKVD
ncbi:2'-5' RNA ligase [Candidatus Roizmanbacteria bacterium RIFCSPLOWO2_01_FULL_44_13]|uniref:RNA 2',3'-cyclic phosphodiesterase n=1 Tax=Candidatus Roizmanbacteria bacterium RIFCSPLOWO2_01_FULL_44_13 TaxID=1802069 RepID=A0A1F7JAN5_9BACT|nr:MAG: 2'-5' RNA ligase [Candidatus Roizmanbacteria bacterium RIFCSPLOWO2_01_FULL_44_13]